MDTVHVAVNGNQIACIVSVPLSPTPLLSASTWTMDFAFFPPSFLRSRTPLLLLIPQSTPSKSHLSQRAPDQTAMFASAIKAGDFMFGHLCGSVVSVVGHAVPSVSEFLNWDIKDLGPIVPEWSV
ncbi:hypothetical protein FI667_g3278, partial [Globisporangium splendens]